MIIVTGGAGFIGLNLVYELNKRNNYNITICDIANSKLKKNYLKKIKYKKIISPSNFFNFLKKTKQDLFMHLVHLHMEVGLMALKIMKTIII